MWALPKALMERRLPVLAGTVATVLLAGLIALPLADDGDDDSNGGTEVATDVGPGTTRPGTTDTGAATGAGGTEGAPAAPSSDAGDAPAPDVGGVQEGTSGSPGGGGEQQAGGTGLGATDRGVTATEIKLGVLLLNVGNVEQLGVAVGVNPEQQRAAWQAYIDEVNEAGGVAGRQLRPVYREYDVTSSDSQRAACLAMTEDEQVFAVLDIALRPAHARCIAHEHETPLVTLQAMPADAYAKSEGRLFTLFAEGSRMLRNLANDLHDRGELRGKTIGILGDTAPGNPETLDAFEAELAALGYEVTHRSRLASDGSTARLHEASAQVPIEVQAMRSSGVDLIFLATGVITATQFVQNADGQGYRPSYVATDWQDAYSDTYVQNMPDSFDGRLITTNRTGEYRRDLPEPPTERACREIYERRTDDRLDRTEIKYNSTVRLCTILEVFRRGGNNAGAQLDAATLSGGIQAIGPMPLSTFGGGSYRQGKFDAADRIRTAAFRSDCSCWVPADAFRDARYS